MRWLHAGWQVVAVAAGLAAAYQGLRRYLARRREEAGSPADRPAAPLAAGFSRRRHIVLGAVFAAMLAVGYGLGVLLVHRDHRRVLTGPHALVGTVAVMFAAIITLTGTALASREDDRPERVHRLFGAAALAVLLAQIVLGVQLIVR